MTHSIQRAIIIGGGIGGLCAAITLRQAGIEATVYEKSERLGEVGAGLVLWPNAIRVLRQLGAAKMVIEAGSTIEHGQFRTAAGKILSLSEPGELRRLYGEPTVAIHRADLHRILLSLLPAAAVQLNTEGVKIEQDATGVTAHLTGGQTDRADLLIGADGVHSQIRGQLLPAVTLRYSGYTAWRGVVDTHDEVALGLTSETWGRGRRFGVVPIAAHRVYWYATLNQPAGRSYTPLEQKKLLQQQFKGWVTPIESLLEATPAETILHHDIYDIPPLARWSEGRVTLLGDAAHPTTPNMGQGACMAIESAYVLARCLATEAELPAALHAYERERRPRTAWVTNQSWQIGRAGQLENGLACWLRDMLVALTPAAVVKARLAKVAGYDVTAPLN